MTGKTTKTVAAPKPSRTKLARETAINVLVKAGKPMAMSELVAKVLARPACKDIPRGTVSAQVSFELGEAEPRIVRHGRGVYAAAGAPVEAPEAS